MNQHPALSSYLIKPAVTKNLIGLRRFQDEIAGLKRTNPHLLPKLVVVLLIWTAIMGTIHAIYAPHQLANQPSVAAAADTVTPKHTSPATAGPSAKLISTAETASVLADDPSGQMLPPVAMAATGTYRNSYASGECTWYVAGRRQVPHNWGNANTWYPRAQAAGWSVGTIPTVGAIAWTPAGSLGHVALVEQISPDYQNVYVSEMNYSGRWVKSFRWSSASSWKYIY